MYNDPLYSLARQRQTELSRAARRTHQLREHDGEVLDALADQRRWRIHWHRHPHATAA